VPLPIIVIVLVQINHCQSIIVIVWNKISNHWKWIRLLWSPMVDNSSKKFEICFERKITLYLKDGKSTKRLSPVDHIFFFFTTSYFYIHLACLFYLHVLFYHLKRSVSRPPHKVVGPGVTRGSACRTFVNFEIPPNIWKYLTIFHWEFEIKVLAL
jgi:hypothetical protein